MTTEEFLALPDDGVERWLVRGELRESTTPPTTKRNRWHSRVLIHLGQLLGEWLDRQPPPRGEVLGGEVGVRLKRDPDTVYGIDLVYVSADLAAEDPEGITIVDGVPVLAVEILSPSDKIEEIEEKVDAYLSAGVSAVWIVDPKRATVLVHRPGHEPELFNRNHELAGDPYLPGFRVPVARIFSRSA